MRVIAGLFQILYGLVWVAAISGAVYFGLQEGWAAAVIALLGVLFLIGLPVFATEMIAGALMRIFGDRDNSA